MNIHPIETLLPHLSDGVLLLDQCGTLILSNQRARALLGCDNGERILQEPLRAALASALERNPLPVRVQLFTTAGVPVEALLTANGQTAVAVLQDRSGASDEIAFANILGIVDSELRAPMEELARTAGAITEALVAIENGDDGRQLPLLMEIASNVLDLRNAGSEARRLQRIMSLAALYGRDPIVSTERISVNQLVADAAERLKPEFVTAGKSIDAAMSENDDAVVYGSRRWLLEALTECVRELATTSSDGEQIRIEIARREAQVAVLVRAGTERRGRSAATLTLGVGALLARRVLEMHGGKLRLCGLPDARELALELPTGGLSAASNPVSDQQAERYAQDIARLLSRRVERGRLPAAGTAEQ